MSLNSISHSNAQDSPSANIADEGLTMSSDMSGPVKQEILKTIRDKAQCFFV